MVEKENTLSDSQEDKYLSYVVRLNDRLGPDKQALRREAITRVWDSLKENLREFKRRREEFNRCLFYDKLVEREAAVAEAFERASPSKIDGRLIRGGDQGVQERAGPDQEQSQGVLSFGRRVP